MNAESPEWSISKLQFRDLVCRLAGGLRKIAGVEENDVVLVISANSVRTSNTKSISQTLIICI